MFLSKRYGSSMLTVKVHFCFDIVYIDSCSILFVFILSLSSQTLFDLFFSHWQWFDSLCINYVFIIWNGSVAIKRFACSFIRSFCFFLFSLSLVFPPSFAKWNVSKYPYIIHVNLYKSIIYKNFIYECSTRLAHRFS